MSFPSVYLTLHYKILVGILRHYVVLLLQSPPKKQSQAAIREQYVVVSILHLRVDNVFQDVLWFARISYVRQLQARRCLQVTIMPYPNTSQTPLPTVLT